MANVFFEATRPDVGRLWKLGPDGSITFWANIEPGAADGNPNDFTLFNASLWGFKQGSCGPGA